MLDPVVLHGSPAKRVMLMAGLEHVSCSMLAIVRGCASPGGCQYSCNHRSRGRGRDTRR